MRIPTTLSLLTLSFELLAQTTFAPEGATWVYTVSNPWTGNYTPTVFTATGDTVIQGFTCQRIEMNVVPCTYFYFQDSYPRLFTRTSGDSLFWFDRSSDAFRLLVPFNSQPGDSWELDLPSNMDDPEVMDIARFTVQAVVLAQIDGQTLRRLQVSQQFITDNGYLRFPQTMGIFTERLGHDYFMIPWLMQCADAPTPAGMTCYSDPEMSWPDPETPCNLSTSITDDARQAPFSVTPTLLEVGGTVRVSTPLAPNTHARWQLTDVLGRTVQEGTLQQPSMTLTLQRSGTYLITVTTDGGVVRSQRIVVR